MTVTSRLLAIAETIDLAHHELCDVAEGLIQATTPTEPAPGLEVAAAAPSPLVVLPTVDEIADVIHVSDCAGETDVLPWNELMEVSRHAYLTEAAAVLDLFAARVPHWVRIEPGTDVKAGTHLLLFKPSGEYACVIAAQDSELSPDPNGGTWYVDPRTIPAEPEDPALAVIIEWMDTPPLGNDAADASDLLTRIDAARADA